MARKRSGSKRKSAFRNTMEILLSVIGLLLSLGLLIALGRHAAAYYRAKPAAEPAVTAAQTSAEQQEAAAKPAAPGGETEPAGEALPGTAATAEPAPTPEPTPEPTPFPEPELEADCAVTFDRVELESGALLNNGVRYVRLSEVADALGLEPEMSEDGESCSFPWRRSRVNLQAYSSTMNYLDEDRELAGPVLLCDGGKDMLLPVESFCDGAQIGLLFDEEFNRLYCTPGAGKWDVPPGYNVPVFMYHGVGWGAYDANLFVNTEDLEKQFIYLLENGYTPIWFSDLEHVDEIQKPVLLTFDDGWQNNYENLLPLAEKYQVKVTVFMVWDFFTISGNHLDEDEALEMYNCGYIDFQSHTMSHTDLTDITDPEKWEYELSESRLRLTRLFGREPFALSYPIGGSNKEIEEMTRQYYHFAVKMTSPDPYNTSDDPILIYRFFPEKWTPMATWISWLERAFPPEEYPQEPASEDGL